jgi:hypothetical protein
LRKSSLFARGALLLMTLFPQYNAPHSVAFIGTAIYVVSLLALLVLIIFNIKTERKSSPV